MTSAARPTVSPSVMAELTESAPARVVRKIDAAPRLADAWTWSSDDSGAWHVVTDSGETVTLRPVAGVIREIAQIGCTCLLVPRCLHVLGTLRVLEVAGDESENDEEVSPRTGAQAAGDESDTAGAPLSMEQRHAALQAWRAGAEILDAGATAAGAVLQAELLRAVHSCRAAGLHRAAAAGLRVVRGIRDLHESKPEQTLADLAASTQELVRTTHELTRDPARPIPSAWLGRARRAYEPAGSLRLYGLFCEPIVTATGYAGVVTYLCDARGQLWTVSNVAPGREARALDAYGAGVSIGDVSVAHARLSREGLFVQNATASADGRLGAGAGVEAVRAGACAWNEPPVAHLFERTLTEQLDRASAALEGTLGERRAGDELVFLRAVVLGADEDSLVIAARAAEGDPVRAVRCLVASEHSVLAYRENLRVLARARGIELLVIGRVRFDQPDSISLFAFSTTSAAQGSADGRASLVLPAEWSGRCNVAFDRLQGAYVEDAKEDSAVTSLGEIVASRFREVPDPLDSLRRRTHRVVLGGRPTLTPETLPQIDREAALLERRLMPAGAQALRALASAAAGARRDATGARRRGDPELFARAWLRAAAYERAATRALRRSVW